MKRGATKKGGEIKLYIKRKGRCRSAFFIIQIHFNSIHFRVTLMTTLNSFQKVENEKINTAEVCEKNRQDFGPLAAAGCTVERTTEQNCS